VAERVVTRRFAVATLANWCFFIAVTSFFSLPVQLEALGASRAQVGRIMGMFGVAALLFIPATGALSDRFGRRRFMIAGAVGFACSAAAFALVDRLGAPFYLLRFAQGVAFSLCFVAVNAMIVDLAPPGALGRAIALFGATTLVAHAIGPSLGEWVAKRFGFSVMFELSALFALGAALVFAFVPDVPRVRSTPDARENMLALAFRQGARGALVAALLTALTFGAAVNFMPIFVRSRNLPSHAPFFIAYVVAAVGVRLVGSGLGDRAGHRRVAALSALGFALAAGGFALTRTTTELVLLALVFGLSHGLTYPSMNAIFVVDAPEAARGRAMALFNLSFNVGITLSAFAAGELAERFGYAVMWLVVGSAALGASAVLVLDRAPA
jgi:MFS family permease